MTVVVIALVFSLVLCGFALRANARFQGESRLPMQWWITGEVTWSASRTIALAFVPALAVVVFLGLIVLFLDVPPRPGQEGLVLPTVVGIGAMFLGIQLLHLWLIDKTLRRNGS